MSFDSTLHNPFLLAALAALMSACSNQPAESAADKAARRAAALPLEKTVFLEKVSDENRQRRERIHVAFGQWLVNCHHVQPKTPGQMGVATCSLDPWNGRTIQERPQPLIDRVTVQTANHRQAQLRIMTRARADDTSLTLTCGQAKVAAEDNRLKFVYEADAARFIRQMPDHDCVLTYTPRGATEPIIRTLSARGFSAALSFAKTYVERGRR